MGVDPSLTLPARTEHPAYAAKVGDPEFLDVVRLFIAEEQRHGGRTFGRFWRSAWAKMRRAWRLMDPVAYQWE